MFIPGPGGKPDQGQPTLRGMLWGEGQGGGVVATSPADFIYFYCLNLRALLDGAKKPAQKPALLKLLTPN